VPRVSLSLLRYRSLFSVLGAAAVLACAVVPSACAQTTTFTGTVYSPRGPASGDPIPNILVFVEDPNNPAPTSFGKGISVPNGGCSVQPSLVPVTVLGNAITKPDGTFSFNVAGLLPNPVRLFIQAGKWRAVQAIPLNNIVVGGSNTYTLSMPSVAVAGVSDLPNIAVVTGSADDVECIFPQIGISTNEVSDPTGTGHINFFSGNGASGEIISASGTPTETQLVNPSASSAIPLTNYDLVIFGCQGPNGRTEADASTYPENVVAYANSGGRVFATHWEYSWIQNATEWSPLASFSSSTSTSSVTTTGQLSTSYSGEPILAAWMNYIGALDISPANLEFTLTSVFYENVLAVNPPAQTWVTLPNYSNSPNQFSFDTPLGANGTPTAALNFANSTSTFLTGDPDDIVTVTVSNTSTSPTVAGLTLSLTIPTVLQVISIVDSSGGAWSCTFTSPNATCTLPVPLAGGASDSVAISFKIPLGTPLGIYSLTGVLSQGGLNQSQQCGRVLYNDYHVEKSVTSRTLWNNGASCSTAKLDDAQKFLEYSLYNLSSFVAPANSDSIQIQQSSTITWNPPSPAYYGTTIAQIEDASVNTPGTSVYSFTPTGTDLLDAKTYTFKVNFTPTDIVDYLTSSATQAVTILPDPTTAAINSLVTPIYYGQEIGFENGVNATINIATQQGLPNLLTTPTLSGGTFTLAIDGTVVCTGAGGIGVLGGASPGACPDAKLLNSPGWIAGTHTLNLSYSGTTDFAAPTPFTTSVVINSDPTTTTLTTTGTGNSTYGGLLTYTAQVADAYATPVGTLTFYDSPTAVSGISSPGAGMQTIYSAPVVNNSASFSMTTLAVGTHNILACFAAPLDSLGYPNMAPSCSASTPQVVASVPSSPDPTQSLLTSNVNPSYFGQAVTFTSNISTTGAFVAIPTGTVTFYDSATAIGTGTLDGNGIASFTTSSLAIGSHSMTASYGGQGAFSSSVSTVYTQVVNSPLTSAGNGFILQVVPTNITMGVGASVSVAVTIVELNNFQQPVQLSCAGLPSEATCTFAQSLIPESGGATQLAIGATAPHNCGSSAPYFAAGGKGMGMVWLGATGLILFLARKRRLLQSLAVAAALLLLPALQGCGTGNCTDFGLKPGTYTFTVTGVSTGTPSVTRTQAMTMTVTIQ